MPERFMITDKLTKRFWAKVDQSGGADACWPWTRGGRGVGYGAFKAAGRAWDAHRVAWIITNGWPDDGLLVCHRCDNRACCNPAHLFLGSYQDNAVDAVEKGRMEGPRRARTVPLTDDELSKIRDLHVRGIGIRELCRQFNVPQTSMRRILA